MYEKVKKFRVFVFKDSTLGIIAGVFTISFILFLVFTQFDMFHDMFHYPEETYQILEEEADILIKNNSFETNYDLAITNYDFKDKNLTMKLSSSSAILNININNYGQSNQEYNRYREHNSATPYILGNAFGIFVLTVSVFALAVLITLISASALQLIAFIIHKIIKLVRKK